MAKGLHTQGAAVLFERLPSLDELVSVLSRFPGVTLEKARGTDWMCGAPGVSLPLGDSGRLVVLLFDRPWPDAMGDRKDDPELLFGAWMLGFFGPFTFPGGLTRAVVHARQFDRAAQAVERHTAFVRIVSTYVLETDDPVLPAGYDAAAELEQVTAVACAIGNLAGALAYFNPNGEVLLAPQCRPDRNPFQTWTNLRVHPAPDAHGWWTMDTVGLGQLDVPDLEACFPEGEVVPEDVAPWLRGISHLLVKGRVVMTGGEILDGPSGRWRVWRAESLYAPPRPVIRMFPGTTPLPPALWRGRAT